MHQLAHPMAAFKVFMHDFIGPIKALTHLAHVFSHRQNGLSQYIGS
jgi:hypothetical protein